MPGQDRIVGRIVGLALAAALLSGCAAIEETLSPEEVARDRNQYVPGESAIYCYQTLGVPDCYSEPQPGPPNRYIMGYDNR